MIPVGYAQWVTFGHAVPVMGDNFRPIAQL